MDRLIENVFSRAWFWLAFVPLIIATCAAGVGQEKLMIGMFIVAGVFGTGCGLFHASQNGWFE